MLKIFTPCLLYCGFIFHRIRIFQLCFDFFEWFNFECSFNGNMWHIFCVACIRMWFKFKSCWKRCIECGFIFWHHMLIAFVGIPSRYKGPSLHHTTNIVCGLCLIMCRVISWEFLHFCYTSLSQRIFVSKSYHFHFQCTLYNSRSVNHLMMNQTFNTFFPLKIKKMHLWAAICQF